MTAVEERGDPRGVRTMGCSLLWVSAELRRNLFANPACLRSRPEKASLGNLFCCSG